VFFKNGQDRFLVLFFLREYFENIKRIKLEASLAYRIFRFVALPGHQYHVIHPSGLNIREEPKPFASVVGYVRMGDIITSLNAHPRQDSSYVQIGAGKYVKNKREYLARIKPKPSRWCITWCHGVDVYDSYHHDGKRIGHIKAFEHVAEHERKGQWMRIHRTKSKWIRHMVSVSRVRYARSQIITPPSQKNIS
jgi:hypothetical protein